MVKAKRSTQAARNAIQLAELGLAAPQVVAHRLGRMARSGPTMSARDRKEFAGMVIEKQVAFVQAWTAMFAEGMRWQQSLAMSLLTGASPRQHANRAVNAAARLAGSGLAPVHRKGGRQRAAPGAAEVALTPTAWALSAPTPASPPPTASASRAPHGGTTPR